MIANAWIGFFPSSIIYFSLECPYAVCMLFYFSWTKGNCFLNSQLHLPVHILILVLKLKSFYTLASLTPFPYLNSLHLNIPLCCLSQSYYIHTSFKYSQNNSQTKMKNSNCLWYSFNFLFFYLLVKKKKHQKNV